jgi:hypothetical protein
MVERSENLRLPLETGEPVRISSEVVGEELEGDVATEDGIPRPPDLAHAAGTQRRNDFVGAKADTGGQSHARSGASRKRSILIRLAVRLSRPACQPTERSEPRAS